MYMDACFEMNGHSWGHHHHSSLFHSFFPSLPLSPSLLFFSGPLLRPRCGHNRRRVLVSLLQVPTHEPAGGGRSGAAKAHDDKGIE